MKMQHSVAQLIPLSSIDVSERIRDIDEAWAQALAVNFEEFGFQTPISLRPSDDGRFLLVAGGHRRRAAEILGWTELPAFILDLDDDQARILEIDENLMRRELSKLDRMISLKERKAIHERMHPATRHGGDRKPTKSQSFGTWSKRFTLDVAEKVGLSESAVQLAIQIATTLDKEAIAHLRGTPFADNQNALLKLSNETPARQRTLALQIRDGKARTLDAARIAAGFDDNVPAEELDPQGRYLATLMATWVKADAKTRARFLAEVKLAEDAAATNKPVGKKGGAK